MDTAAILIELRTERERIDRAIAAIEGLDSISRPKRGRPAKAAGTTGRPRRRNRLSPEGRKRLSDMMKKRWAERKRKQRAA
jgi:hypothetical protein